MQSLTSALSMSKPASSADALPVAAVDALMLSLRAQLGAKFADAFGAVPLEELRGEWAQRLAGFRRHELERGLNACSNRRFAPTLGEFKVLCRPALEAEYAWEEAKAGMAARAVGQKGVWTHPAVYRAASAMDYELRALSFQACRKRWEIALQREMDAGWGDPIPEARPVLEHKPLTTRPPTPEERARIKTLLARRAPEPEPNHSTTGEQP